ncbi:MAG TPA: hypothetical protein VG267_17605 [Terracidiphilus sp.]|jgi:hypothetical protein|nr:hypothetical protein [Terracidiphilus sp.]
MIARTWRGWTTPANANSYENFLKHRLLPGLRALEGYRGGQILRRDLPTESEFVVINYFDSIDAVKRFAGDNYTVAAFEPEAKLLLSRIENEATHYEVRLDKEPGN